MSGMETLNRAAEPSLLRALIERFDWRGTPLGDPSGWPQSLRTALSICLSSRFPMIIFWGPQLVQLYNDAYAPILGARHPGALGQRAQDCWPEIWDAIEPMLRGVLERGEATWSENLLLPLERYGVPEELYFTFSYSPISDGDGIGGVFCAVAETTATILREREARERAEALAELDRAKTEFFNNVSHEFRTPLTLILGPLDEWLRGETIGDARLAADLALMRRNARRLQRLVNTLLDFNRLEANRLGLRPVGLDPGRFTADVASTFRSAMDAAGLAFAVDIEPLEPAMLDPRLWETIVLNLLSNALKFTLEGSVTLALRQAGGMLRLTVRDTGSGVAEPHRAFERFWRADGQPARSHEGSGIGLALVREIAELHGGSVAFESAVGEGSTVTVELPFVPATATALQTAAPALADLFVDEAAAWSGSSVPLPSPNASARPRVLVVDDNADLRAYIARLLGDLYDVTLAADGTAALAQTAAVPPDLIVCDVMMPGIDGIAFVRRLRADPHTRELPVLLLSARVDEDAAASAIGAGADGYITKPFAGAELLVQIERRLKQSRIRREEEARFRAIADQVAHVIYTHTPDGTVDWANARWYEYSQLPASLALHPEGWAQVIEPGDLARLLSVLDEAFRTQAAYEIELRIKPAGAPDDRYRWFLLRAVPIRDDAGNVVRWAGSQTDVHDHRLAEDRARERLLHEFDREHRTSLAFQNAALPRELPTIRGIAFDAVYVASQAGALVGGDWYDAFRLADGRIVLSVGDVMGSGLDAAVTMGAVRQAIRGAAQLYPDAASIVDAADRALRTEQPERIVTAFVGILDPVMETLSYTSAGHPMPLLRGPDGAVAQLAGADLPLGLRDLETAPRAARWIDVPPGTTLLLYTDGLTEASRDVVDGERRLIDAFAEGIDDAATLRDRVAPRPTDDIAILLISVAGVERRRWAADALHNVAAAQLRALVAAELQRHGADDPTVGDAELVLGELLANVARHTGNGSVEVALDLDGAEPVLHVLDRGPGFTMHARLPNDPMSESGRGLFIIGNLVREISVVRRTGGGSHARAVLKVSGADRRA